jgi:hypothetical protein
MLYQFDDVDIMEFEHLQPDLDEPLIDFVSVATFRIALQIS